MPGVLYAKVGGAWVAINTTSGGGGGGTTDPNALLPVGAMTEYAGDTSPNPNWMLCQGQAISRAVYGTLFAAVGTKFGVGDGSTTFNIPDMRGRYACGSGGAFFTATGSVGGSADAIVPTHSHAGTDHLHAITHNHATATSATQSASHTHAGAAHTHAFSDTSSSTSAAGGHSHGPGGTGTNFLAQTSGGLGSTGAGNTLTNPTLTDAAPAHTHTVAVSGTTGAASATTTGAQSASHTHTVDLASFTGNSGLADRALTTGTAGVPVANANLPPSVALNYIMKVL